MELPTNLRSKSIIPFTILIIIFSAVFSRIPFLKKYNLRAIIGVRGVWGELSDENIALSTTTNPNNIPLVPPNDKIYWEYSAGIGNIFKIFRLDFNFRGNYLDNPDARKFGVTGTFGFHF